MYLKWCMITSCYNNGLKPGYDLLCIKICTKHTSNIALRFLLSSYKHNMKEKSVGLLFNNKVNFYSDNYQITILKNKDLEI